MFSVGGFGWTVGGACWLRGWSVVLVGVMLVFFSLVLGCPERWLGGFVEVFFGS